MIACGKGDIADPSREWTVCGRTSGTLEGIKRKPNVTSNSKGTWDLQVKGFFPEKKEKKEF